MKTSSAKQKGRRLCLDIRQRLIEKLGLNEDDVIVQPTSVPGMDITLSAKGKSLFPYAVEAKNQERLQVWQALNQAQTNASGLTPILIFTRNRAKTFAVLELDHFLELLSRAQ